MSRTNKDSSKHLGRRSERKISVRAVRRAEIDTRKLGRALLAAALAQAEADAQAATQANGDPDQRGKPA